jgi:F0F1-type ATP synthase assembly protein I
MPFAAELSGACDWVQFVQPAPLTAEFEQAVRMWRRRDEENGVLKQDQSIKFVRDVIIENANMDLGSAVSGASAISVDSLHRSVLEARIKDAEGWRVTGFAVPILFPYVPDLEWDDIANLRRHPEIEAYRHLLTEVESEVFDETSRSGDVEAAIHHAYEVKLRQANERIEGLGAAVGKQVVLLGVGIGIGVVTMIITGPLGLILGVAPNLTSGVVKIRQVANRRKRNGWIALDSKIADLKP